MIEQIPIYLLCFLLGWLPLYAGYRFLEAKISFKLEFGQTKFSYFSFLFLIYMISEVARSYSIMLIVHDYLAYDFDLILGVFIWLVALTWPPRVPTHYRSSAWLSFVGIYLYLMPEFVWVLPVGLIALFFLGVHVRYRMVAIAGAFFSLSIYFGFNSLYLWLFFLLMAFLVAVSVVQKRQSLVH